MAGDIFIKQWGYVTVWSFFFACVDFFFVGFFLLLLLVVQPDKQETKLSVFKELIFVFFILAVLFHT